MSSDNSIKLWLHQEQLDIAKKLIKTAEVSVHMETCTEEKNITVPVIREELVIEKKPLNSEASNNNDEASEIIRIPISKEEIEIVKNKMILEDVSIYTEQIQSVKHIEETIKKEELKVTSTGKCTVVDDTIGTFS